jgi:hypothetical protein
MFHWEFPMPLEHKNRMGDVYYLHAGTTKTGKPRYWMSKKPEGNPLDAVPEGFEIYEEPEQARVVIRRLVPSSITPSEREQVAEGIRRQAGLNHFIVDVDGDSLVVSIPSMGENEADRFLEKLGGPFAGITSAGFRQRKDWYIQRSTYSKMLRFTLAEGEGRLFRVERWCFRGAIDNWISLFGRPAPLEEQVRKYAVHLGKESFFELM